MEGFKDSEMRCAVHLGDDKNCHPVFVVYNEREHEGKFRLCYYDEEAVVEFLNSKLKLNIECLTDVTTIKLNTFEYWFIRSISHDISDFQNILPNLEQKEIMYVVS